MRSGRRPPLDEQKALFEATVAVEGITTAAGDAGGTSFVDAGLIGAGADSFVSMMAVIHPGDPNLVDSRDITTFNNATGEVTIASAFKGGQVAAGTRYKIVTFRFVPAEIAALQADVGDASASALGSLYGILGNPAQTFAARTERIEESDAVYFDAVNGVPGTAYPAGTALSPVDNENDLFTILANRSLSKVILLSDLTLGHDYSSVHFYGQVREHILDLNNRSIHDCLFENVTIAGTQNLGLCWAVDCIFDTYTGLRTHGVRCLIRTSFQVNSQLILFHCWTDSASIATDVTWSSGSMMLWKCAGLFELRNITAGTHLIHLDGGELTINANCTGGTINLYGDFRLIDNSAGATVNDYRTIKEVVSVQSKDQWCQTPLASLAISNVAADLTFSDVVIPSGFLPSGATVLSVHLMLKWRKQVDSSGGANAINGASKTIRVKKSSGSWGTDDVVGITFADNQLATDASAAEGGDMIIGSHDVSGEVDDVDNATYNVRSEQTNRADAMVVDAASLVLYDVYTGLRVCYTL